MAGQKTNIEKFNEKPREAGMCRRPSAQELNTRRREVKEFFLQGHSLEETKSVFAASYGVSERSIENDLDIMKQEMREYARSSFLIEEHTAKYDFIYYTSMQKATAIHVQNALKALKQKEELLRLVDKTGTINIINHQNNLTVSTSLGELSIDELNKIKNIIDADTIIEDVPLDIILKEIEEDEAREKAEGIEPDSPDAQG